ncbi:hypothetical protein MTQ20_01380, partial [Corynebacterium bovis]
MHDEQIRRITMNDGGWGRRPGEPRRPSDTAGGDASQWPAGPRDRTGGPEGARAPDPRSAGTAETDQTAQLDLRQWGAAGSSGAGGWQDAAGWQDATGSPGSTGSAGWQDATGSAGSAGSAGWQDAPAAPAEPRRRRGGAVVAGVVVVLVAAVAGGLAAWQPWKTDPAGAAAPSPQFTTTPDRPTTDRSAPGEATPTQRVPSPPTVRRRTGRPRVRRPRRSGF